MRTRTMDEKSIELARTLVESEGFDWREGMRAVDALDSARWARVGDPGAFAEAYKYDVHPCPDLDDPATLGVLEHELLPELYGEDVHLAPRGYREDLTTSHELIGTKVRVSEWAAWGAVTQRELGRGTTKGEALARAVIAWRADLSVCGDRDRQ